MDFQMLLADPFAIFAGLGVFAIIFIILAVIATSIFWLWMLVEAITSTRLNGTEKLIWVIVIFFGHFLGALIYFLVGRGGARSGPMV